jgi:hypothetical protein
MDLFSTDGFDLQLEFADPLNYDSRLQAHSHFRGTGTDGSDPEPFQ